MYMYMRVMRGLVTLCPGTLRSPAFSPLAIALIYHALCVKFKGGNIDTNKPTHVSQETRINQTRIEKHFPFGLIFF